MFIGIINHILTDDNVNGKTSAQKAYLADTLTTQAREILGLEWENSPIRSFMNHLRRHVRGEEFTQTWSNGALCSLAAVILKGDEWETLLKFMKVKGMTDYRLAFALYGVFNGFANLTRDFTDLLLNNDSSYVTSVYKEFHHQLFNKDIDISNQVFDLSYSKDNETTTNHVVTDTPITTISFAQRVLDFFFSDFKKEKNRDELESGLRQALQRIGNNEDGYVFICVLNDYPKWGARTNAWKKMKAEFCPDYEKIRNPLKSNSNRNNNNLPIKDNRQLNDSDMILGGLFSTKLSDAISQHQNDADPNISLSNGPLIQKIHFDIDNIDSLLKIIHSLNPDLSNYAIKLIREDLLWVFDPKYISGKSGMQLLEDFRLKLTSGKTESKSRNGKDMTWKMREYRPIDIEKTIIHLRKSIFGTS